MAWVLTFLYWRELNGWTVLLQKSHSYISRVQNQLTSQYTWSQKHGKPHENSGYSGVFPGTYVFFSYSYLRKSPGFTLCLRKESGKSWREGCSKIKIEFAKCGDLCNMLSVSLTCKPGTSDIQLVFGFVVFGGLVVFFFFTQDSSIISNTLWLATAEREVCHVTFVWPTWINMSLKAFLGNIAFLK